MYGLPDPHKAKSESSSKSTSSSMLGSSALPGTPGVPGSIPGLPPGMDDPYGLGAMNSMYNPYSGYNPAAAAALQMQLQYAAAAQNQMMMAGELCFNY